MFPPDSSRNPRSPELRKSRWSLRSDWKTGSLHTFRETGSVRSPPTSQAMSPAPLDDSSSLATSRITISKPKAALRTMAAICLMAGSVGPAAQAAPPLKVHPQNPYIFEFRGEPTILRTFGEHYGSVINPDFDFIRYLDVLERDGNNLTRVVLLGFRTDDVPTLEPLSPAAAKFMQPWARVPGHGNALDGQPKWDLSVWNEGYFTRLRNFAQACADRGIVVEMSLFNTIYAFDANDWDLSPFNPANNVQGHGPSDREDAVRLTEPNLVAAQQAAVRRIVRELNPYDNIYYEIQNEPFWNGPDFGDSAEVAFHNAILGVIRNEESTLPNRHLVAHNFPEYSNTLSSGFDIINSHYPFNVTRSTWSPVIGGENLLATEYSRGKVLSLDEASSSSGLSVRVESWMFVLGGGGVYSGLDAQDPLLPLRLNYTSQNEAGDIEPAISIRKQLRNLGTYADTLHLPALRRNLSWITGGIPSGARVQGMASPSQQYVAYLHHGAIKLRDFVTVYDINTAVQTANLQVTLPAGDWRAVWTRPDDLSVLRTETFTHAGGSRTLLPVTYQADVALKIDRTGAADITPPPSPKSLIAGAPVSGAVSLSWNTVQAADLAFHHIYHATSPAVPVTPGNRIAILSAGQTSFIHGSVAMNSPHYYVVTSVDSNGNESAASREVCSVVASQPFGGAPWTVPATIQCEDFDTGGQGIAYNDLTTGNAEAFYRPAEDVDIATTSDSEGGYHVNGTTVAEWLNYTVRVLKTDTFNLDLRCLSPSAGGQVRVFVDGTAVGSVVSIPASGSWQTVRIPDIAMNEGSHVLRLSIIAAGASGDAGSFNLFTLTPKQRTGPNAHAGADQSLLDSDWNLTESVTLNAASSVAGSSPITSYSWVENDVVIASGINPTLALSAGEHRIHLVTTDSAGLTDSDELRVTVSPSGFVNGGFEPNTAGWTTIGSVVVSSSYTPTQGTKLVIFNDNNTPPNGVLEQSFPTVPGQLYRLRFDMGVLRFNTDEQAMRVRVTGGAPIWSKTYSANGTGGGTLVWSAEDETFTADSTVTTVEFGDISSKSDSIDLMLDNVRITRVLAGGLLPDPASIERLPSAWKIRVTSPDVGLYKLQRSANLAEWTTIQQRQVSAPGLIEFTDTTASGTEIFYRIGLDQP